MDSVPPILPPVTLLERCQVCDHAVEEIFHLPELPLTDTFLGPEDVAPAGPRGFDCTFLRCTRCGHGQLKQVVAPELLYGTRYGFRTSGSANARSGTRFFRSFLETLCPGRAFRSILDLGCNDLHLLRQLDAPVRVGIDPIWRGLEHTCPDPAVTVVGKTLEELDLHALLPEPPDLIVCRHTLEHMQAPKEVLARLLEVAAPGALLVFEVPGQDILLARLRFDQVFHQHLQYFSRASFTRLLYEVGAKPLAFQENPRDWGALAVAFTKGSSPGPLAPVQDVMEVRRRFGAFQALLAQAGERLNELPGPVVGYGASQMLPVLAWHLGPALSRVEVLYDDDPAKEGLRYWNLPFRVTAHLPPEGLREHSVVLTAVEHSAVLIRRIVELGGAREILSPFQVF